MSNIKRIRIKNFKNLEDVEIEVKPLTFLFGPNGSGKSSFLKAMMFLSKNISPVNTGKTLYKLSDDIDLGTFKDIVTNNEESKIIEFEFDIQGDYFFPSFEEFNKDDKQLKRFFDNPNIYKYDKIFDSFEYNVKLNIKFRDISFIDFDNKVNLFEYIVYDNTNNSSFKFSQNLYDGEIDLTEIEIDKYNIEDWFYSKDYPNMNSIFSKESLYIKSIDISNLINLYIGDVSVNINCIRDHYFHFSNEYMNFLENFSINEIINSKLNEYNNSIVSEEWNNLTNDEKINLFYEALKLIYLSKIVIPNNLSKYFHYIYMPSIREFPKSKYLIQYEDIDSSEYFGFLKILLDEKTLKPGKNTFRLEKTYKKNGLIIRSPFFKINEYLEKLGFDFQFDIAKNEDAAVIYLFKDNFEFNLADASSGVIQIFPILVSLTILTISNTRLFVEQPELHLHPKLQSKLADIFSDTIKNSDNNLFIETHSEHLIRKIQVLIAEGNIDKNKVSVMYFNNKNGVTKVENMEIDDNGLFIKDWPDGFFDDSVNLTMELFEALRKRKN